MTLLLRTSIHLNMSLERLKITFRETAQEYFLSSKFDNVLSTFFVDDLYQILSLFQSLLGFMTLLLRTSTHLNKSLTRLKITFHKTAQEYFLSSKFDNVLSTFFVDDLYQILSLFQSLLGFMTLLLRTSTHLNKSLTRLKITFHKTAQEYFLSSKFDNVLSTFFVDDLCQILSLFQNLPGLWHSYLGPQSIWTSPWQDWKSLLMKLHKSIFWAQNLTTC